MKQNILPTNADRAAFKKRVTELLEPLQEEFDIEFKFGPITECFGGTPTARTKMTFKRTKPRSTDIERKNKWMLEQEAARKKRYAEYRKDITIGRRMNEGSFCPMIYAKLNGIPLFEFSLELLHSAKFGDWTGMFSEDGKPDQVLSDGEAVRELLLACQHDKPQFTEQIDVAFQMLKEEWQKFLQ